MKYSVKKGDTVSVISGKWKGEQGKIIAVIRKNERVVLEMIGLSPEKQQEIGRKTVKKTPDNPKGGLIERAVSVHISNVKLKVKGEKETKTKKEEKKA
ncbi:MAG TPA: 50S ribosomal protein L24 [Lentisphaeria bacterium]|nr:50S ribosomal protein L24 [Lentisphaeria bacterium]